LTYTKTLKGKVYHVNNTIDSNKIIYLSPSVSEDENFAVVMAQSVYRQLLEKILDRCLTYTKTLKGEGYHVNNKIDLNKIIYLSPSVSEDGEPCCCDGSICISSTA
jgi:hypothetical protein